MKNQFAKIVAVLMVLAMAVSVFGLCASAAETTTEANTTVLLGDVNLDGKVSIQDATLIQKALAKLATLDEVQAAAAEVTEDGEVNIKDVTMIQKWLANYEDVNQNIGKPMATGDEATPDVPGPSTGGEATPDVPGPSTDDQPAVDPEVPVDPSTKDEETPADPEVPVDPSTKDEETPADPEVPVDPATDDEATADEAAVAYYLVGWINNADVYDTTYAFVDGTITVELVAESYVAVQDEFGTIYWTDGWLDFNPTSAVLGSYAVEDKFHVAAGTVTLTWDAATCTLARA